MACKLLVQSRADALFVAVKVHLLVELGGLLALTRQNTTFLGSSKVKSWHLSDLSLGAEAARELEHIPAVFWEVIAVFCSEEPNII